MHSQARRGLQSSSRIIPPSDSQHILLHHEAKLFWRERINADICIVYFPRFNIIEIIGFDIDDAIESPHLYCNKDRLSECISAFEVESLDESQKVTKHRRLPLNSHYDISEKAIQRLIVEFIINKLLLRKSFKQKVFEEVKDEIVITCERCKRCVKCLK